MKADVKVKNKEKKQFKKVISIFLVVSLCIVTVLTVGLSIYLFSVNKTLNIDENYLKQINSQIEIYDNENDALTVSSNQKSKVKLEDLPSYVPASFLSIEDKKFYSHNGLNYKRIVGALYHNIRQGKSSEGASTISQQLVKNTHLTNEKTLKRKIKEMLLTLKLEKKFSKDEILETYLNAIYFGNGAYGLDSASKVYFNKVASDLTLAQSACLAGLIKSPKTYSPIFNKENCLNRRNLVLKEMLKDNVITNNEYKNAIKEEIILSGGIVKSQNFYEKAVLDEASQLLNISEKDLATKGYYIFTYLDKKAQNSLTNALNNDEFYHKNSYGNTADSAGIIIDNKTGGIVAFSGRSNYDIVQMKRSPGSSIKPVLVYAPALENGVISPISPLLDEPTNFSGYSPQNVSGKYYGYVSATESVEKSLNIPAIKIMQVTGIQNSIKMAEKCGIKFDSSDKNYAIALGGMTKGTTLKELANSYLPFSNNGNFIEAKFIKKICDKNGNVIYSRNQIQKQVMSEETAYLMTEMLVSGVKKGTSSRLSSLPYEVAGKTGTVGIKNTNLNSDVWSVAYTSSHTFSAWLGNSTGQAEYMLEGSNNGGTYCTSLLKNCMENVYENNFPTKFNIPDGVVEVALDSQELEINHSLMLADSNTPEMFMTKAKFNSKYAPKLVAKSFSELKAVELSVKVEKHTPMLTFTALPQVEYKVYRINDDECKVVKTIKGKKGLQEIYDNEVNDEEFYTYYIEAFATNYATQVQSKRIRSNSVKVYLSSKFENEILN